MKRLIALAALLLPASLTLQACETFPNIGTESPAPLAKTTIDDTALETADKGFDVAIDAITMLTDLGKIVPGTPKAKAIAAAIRKVDSALTVAAAFAEAGHETSYLQALAQAQAGITELRVLLKQ